jgi:hypothetical protein
MSTLTARIYHTLKSRNLIGLSRKDGTGIVEWTAHYFETCGALSTLGAGFSFTTMLNSLDEPPPGSRFTKQQVRRYLALAYLLFTMSLGFAVAGATLLSFHSRIVVRWYDTKARKAHAGIWLVIVAQQLLLYGAFAVSMLAVMAYVEDVAWVGVALVLGFLCFVSFWWLFQSMYVTSCPTTQGVVGLICSAGSTFELERWFERHPEQADDSQGRPAVASLSKEQIP